jgi:hypothetical protein
MNLTKNKIILLVFVVLLITNCVQVEYDDEYEYDNINEDNNDKDDWQTISIVTNSRPYVSVEEFQIEEDSESDAPIRLFFFNENNDF